MYSISLLRELIMTDTPANAHKAPLPVLYSCYFLGFLTFQVTVAASRFLHALCPAVWGGINMAFCDPFWHLCHAERNEDKALTLDFRS